MQNLAKNLAEARESFTLVELLIVVSIVTIMSAVVISAINPAEMLKAARDTRRMEDLNSIKKAISWFEADTGGAGFMGSSSVVYVSIPDTSPTCANLGLPTLPPGWSYACASTSTYRNTNGTGWIPINFNQMSFNSPFSSLPVDPINTTSSGNYYTYVTGGEL